MYARVLGIIFEFVVVGDPGIARVCFITFTHTVEGILRVNSVPYGRIRCICGKGEEGLAEA